MTAVKANAQEVQSAPQSVHDDDKEIIVFLDKYSECYIVVFFFLVMRVLSKHENAELSRYCDILDTENENSKNESHNQTAFLSYSVVQIVGFLFC